MKKKSSQVQLIIIVIIGFMLMAGGLWGLAFTYRNVAREKIITPADAAIPGVPVRGPWTLKAQADIIRTHALRSTGGLTFAEMPRQIPQVNANGTPVLGADGQPVLVANEARDLWITATTLITALNLGIMAYAFFSLAFVLGLVMLSISLILRKIINN